MLKYQSQFMLTMWAQYGCQTTEQPVKGHIQTAFVKEYQEEGKILIKLMNSEENNADINTKSTPNTTFKTHQAKTFWEKDEITRKDSSTQVSIDRKDVKNMLWHIAHDTYFVRYVSNCTI